jgi:hypothetical protein
MRIQRKPIFILLAVSDQDDHILTCDALAGDSVL